MIKLDSNFVKWFRPGMHIKRWLVLLLIGVAVMGLGFGYFLREIYQSYTFPGWAYYVTLQFLPRYARGTLFVGFSAGLILYAIWQLNRSLLSAFLPRSRDESLVNIIYNHHSRRRGPKIVAIGGGTGLSTLLRGLKEDTGNLTAIVTVADDGGSSGVLRRELGLPPPGDVRNCIAALADVEPLMTRLFQHRFDNVGSGLEGHSFGNLFIAAMTAVTGNFEEAVRETSRVLAVRGQILPASQSNVTLSAVTHEDEAIHGEANITERGGRIKQVFIHPENAAANPDAIRAILDADMIVVGPGSLFTSVLPNLLIDGIRRAIEMSQAMKVYVCNVATQHGETDSFAVSDHYQTLVEHVNANLFQYVIANDNISSKRLPQEWHSEPVRIDQQRLDGAVVLSGDVISEENRYHHDPAKLAALLTKLYYERPELAQPAKEPALAVGGAARQGGGAVEL
jgi:uncharacterized cofD-like protein